MLNVGPKADGTICDEEAHAAGNRKMDEEKRRGDYGNLTLPDFGEGPSNSGGSFREKLTFTKKDFRFTYRPGELYVFAMKPNAKNVYRIKSLGARTMHSITISAACRCWGMIAK